MSPKVANILFRQVDNSPLILFRILFGGILAAEALTDLLGGRVGQAFRPGGCRFPFIGFEFLQPLPGNGMYYYFAIMVLLGLLIAMGACYRIAMSGYTILWGITYLMDKPGYQNHYYLLLLVCFLMIFVPANRYCSVDVLRKPGIRRLTCPRWVSLLFIAQVSIIYFYGGVNKLYPDWLNGRFISIEFGFKRHYPVLGPLLQQHWFQLFVVYGGLFFDLLIIPFLLWKPTRGLAFIAAIGFNLLNSVLFRIGVFPYFAMTLFIFFFDPEKIRKVFFARKPLQSFGMAEAADRHRWLVIYGFGLYLLVQAVLPLRHFLYPGNTLWTEEGSRLSWRMMLRFKTGDVCFRITDTATGREWVACPRDSLGRLTATDIAILPDMTWQYARYLKKEYTLKGFPDVQIHAVGCVDLNNHPARPLINPDVDLAKVKWHVFAHSGWILDY